MTKVMGVIVTFAASQGWGEFSNLRVFETEQRLRLQAHRSGKSTSHRN
ncbi:MAG: hypothetical protein AAF703_19460 [Cyanobacteria bacterium P01_D01_bin.105]